MHDLSFTQTFSQGDGIKKAHLPNVYFKCAWSGQFLLGEMSLQLTQWARQVASRLQKWLLSAWADGLPQKWTEVGGSLRRS